MMKRPFFADPIHIEGNVLFLSDAHLGAAYDVESPQREESLIQLLNKHKGKISHLFLLGDIFDYWFEYKDVVPKGFFRFFNVLYELNLMGVKIYFFAGNHDHWVKDYFSKEFGCQIFRDQQAFIINGKRCLVGHGDGIGGKQYKYLILKHIFSFKPIKVLYGMLHPRQSFAIARWISKKSRAAHPEEKFEFKGEDEHQTLFARQVLESESVNCFIYGHRHLPIEYPLAEQSFLFNTGDWLTHFSYLVFNKEDASPKLHFYRTNS